jgi:hypothetical protein
MRERKREGISLRKAGNKQFKSFLKTESKDCTAFGLNSPGL